jgi:phosphate transport system permease protein
MRRVKDIGVRVLVYLSAVVAIIPLVWILVSIVSKGLPVILSADWWTKDLAGTTDRRAGGGALHAIIGTLEIGVITAAIAVPIAILAAIFLIEYGRGTRVARGVSFMVDILSGVPSIVAALFVFALLITILGLGRSAIAAALSLVLLMLPTVLRSTEEMLKLVPDSLREAAYALGIPKWKTIVTVVIPTAFSGIATGVVLGLARVMGETAPLLILVAYARNLYWSPTSDTMGTLPTMINTGRDVAESLAGYDRVWGAALTLILLVMGLNLLARWIARAGRLKDR